MQTAINSRLEQLFSNYSNDHRNATNQVIHVVAVPAILWSVIAMLWCIPSLAPWFQSGIWAALAMFGAWAYYNRLSRPLGIGMLILFFVSGCVCRLLEDRIGLYGLLRLGIGIFVLAWIAQFVGHKIEGRKPSFLTDLTYLLIGPLWVLAKLYRQFGWRY